MQVGNIQIVTVLIFPLRWTHPGCIPQFQNATLIELRKAPLNSSVWHEVHTVYKNPALITFNFAK